MSQDDLIKAFFQRTIEDEYNENLFRRSYVLPQEKVLEYVRNLLEIPVDIFFLYMLKHNRSYSFRVKDIPQYSSIEDATTRLCSRLKEVNDPGLSYVETGVLLRHGDYIRKQGADQKYGENHSKTAADFGLAQISPYSHKIFLSAIGYVFNSLSAIEQEEYLARAILRNSFINCILSRAVSNKILLTNEMSILSQSTINRRLPNVKGYLRILFGKGEEISAAIKNIAFK